MSDNFHLIPQIFNLILVKRLRKQLNYSNLLETFWDSFFFFFSFLKYVRSPFNVNCLRTRSLIAEVRGYIFWNNRLIFLRVHLRFEFDVEFFSVLTSDWLNCTDFRLIFSFLIGFNRFNESTGKESFQFPIIGISIPVIH